MPDDAPQPDTFQQSDERITQLKELARQLRDGSDVPMAEQLKRLKALTAESGQERARPTQADKERKLEELRQKYGDRPKKTLLLKEASARLKDFRAFTQEMRHASNQDLDSVIMMGDVAQVRRLLAKGVRADGLSAAGYSLLLSACVQEQWEIARILRQAGASIGLPEAALLGDLKTLRGLLDSGVDVNARDNKQDLTALNWAASKGKIEAVRLLLQRGADVNSAGKAGFTSLLSAALHKHDNVVALLVEAGVPLGVVEAALIGDLKRLTHLLDAGADIESENSVCMTPLLAASACGRLDCIRQLLDRGADLHKITARHQMALSWAISSDQREAVSVLLDAGMDVNAPDQRESEYQRGVTPIRDAILRGLSDMTRLLIERGARVDVRDARGETPLHWATLMCSPDVMRVLLDAQADINVAGAMQRTPLMSVADRRLIKKDVHVACTRLLLERGADVNAKAEHGKTALMMAASQGNAAIVQLLLEANADIEATDEYGYTALSSAAQDGHADVIALLKQYGATVNRVKDFLGAALMGHKAVLKTLLIPQLRKRKRLKP